MTLGRVRHWLGSALLFSVMTALAFVLVEGLSSGLALTVDLLFHRGRDLPSRIHVRHDDLVGWVNRPDVDLPDMYGPGISLRTNSQGFRSYRDFGVRPPAGMRRIVCSGNSFTLGIGVDNSQTWCELLGTLDSSIETINMGQAGYGVDQAYLLYKRESRNLQHDIHVFAFITDDFRRMRSRKFVGYNKPMLQLRNSELVTLNVPVAPHPFWVPWWIANADAIRSLGILRLAERLREGRRRPQLRRAPAIAAPIEGLDMAVVMKVFEDLREIGEARGNAVVFVYLDEAVMTSSGPIAWRSQLKQELAKRDLLFVDLVEEFRRLQVDELVEMFDRRWGHYSVKGHRFVARRLYDWLTERPETARRLSAGAGAEGVSAYPRLKARA